MRYEEKVVKRRKMRIWYGERTMNCTLVVTGRTTRGTSACLLMVLLHIALDRDRDMGIKRSDLLLGLGHVCLRLLTTVARGTLDHVGRPSSSAAGSNPVNRDRIEGHVDCTGGQADETAFLTLENYQRKNIASTQDQRDKGPHQGATSNVTELSLGGALEKRGRRHQGPDEKESQPTGDENIVEDQSHGCWGQETDPALAVVAQVGNAEQNHYSNDGYVRYQ